MKNLIRTEEAAIFGLTIFMFFTLDFPWWVFPLFLFIPDISMMGYLWNNRLGALIYNVVHHRALAIAIYLAGIISTKQVPALIGIILLAHSSLDRAMNYGLKYDKGFKFTHLGNL